MPRPTNHPRAGMKGSARRPSTFSPAEIDELKRLSLLYTPPFLLRGEIKILETGDADVQLVKKAHRLLEAGEDFDVREEQKKRRERKRPATMKDIHALQEKIEEQEILITDLSLRIVTLEGG